MFRVKPKDTVVVLTGKDKGKQGEVIAISTKKGKVKVRGIAIVTRHVKARRQGETSTIKKEESFIDLSNVMPVCAKTGKASRINFATSADGAKVRVCNVSKEVLP